MREAVSHHQAGRLAQAEPLYNRILTAQPQHPEALNMLGVLADQTGHHTAALDLISQAITQTGDVPGFHSNLGIVLRGLGRMEEAVAAFERALALQPDFAEAHYNLGNALMMQGKRDEAIATFERALASQPDSVEAHNNLGNALMMQGRWEEAGATFERALTLRPDSADAYSNIANVRIHQGLLDEAEKCLRRALVLQPDFAEAHNNLGNVLKDQARLDEAVSSYRQAILLSPGTAIYRSNLIFVLHYYADSSAEAIYDESRRWAETQEQPLRATQKPHADNPDPERRLRIGYVSPDLREHPVGRFMLALLENHDHTRFEVICYADTTTADGVNERLRACADHWHTTIGWSEERLAEQIRQDGIDILVDLALHTAGSRLPVFARKPAPVQTTWLAYPGTSGLDAMDYRLTDPYLDPPGTDDCYSETSVRLPDTFWCYTAPEAAPEVNTLPVLSCGHVTFGCLNSFSKTNERVLTVWASLLRMLPGSRLILHTSEGGHRERTVRFLAQAGVAPERVSFVSRMSMSEYLMTYQRIDIGLDPFPFAGGTTTCDALWMGVPVVSLVGATAVGRGGLSVLANAGLPELAARSEGDYVAAAAALAADLPRLAALRAGLRGRMLASPLMDAPRFARDVEAAYREMWQDWCRENKGAGDEDDSEAGPPLDASEIEAALQEAVSHHQAGRLTQAEPLYNRILTSHPAHPQALHLLGVLAAQTGHYEPAVELFSQAIAQKSDEAAFHSSLGAALRALGRLSEATASFERALTLQPDFSEAHNNLGNVLAVQGKTDEAVASFRRALATGTGSAEAHNNLGNALNSIGQSDEAIDSFEQAIALKPDLAEAHNNLGNSFKDLARLDEALASYRRAVTLAPTTPPFQSNLVYTLYFHPDFDAGAIYDEHRHWARMHERPRRAAYQPHINTPDPVRRLKIGYVSPDLRDHPVGRGLISLFERHSREHFEIICYADTACPDAVTDRLRNCTDRWHDTIGWTEERMASQIRQDGIDLLVDLSLHMAGSRLPVFARKPAPVQVTFAGYPGTTGLDAMDYRLTDSYLDPGDAEEAIYSEKSVTLPASWWCYTPSEDDPAVSSLPALSAGHITFGCLNTICKVNAHVLTLWADVLNAVPSSRLLLLSRPGSYQEWVMETLQKSGIDREHVGFLGRRPHLQYLALHHQMDVALDTFPYNGHTTSLDALWMGVPVVSLAGATAVGRGGLSVLANAGLPELAARSEGDYVAAAAALAADLPRLAALRAGLRGRMLASPLMDAPRFARDVEAAYQEMWRDWCYDRPR